MTRRIDENIHLYCISVNNMAGDGLVVTISGAAFSLLFYENVRAVGDQMGLLVGEVLQYVTKNVTDADRYIETTKTHINIQGIFPCSSTDLIHESNGKICQEKLSNMIGTRGTSQVVGWYRFRPYHDLSLSLRDKIIHKQLQDLFSNDEKIDFVACMLNYHTTPLGGTHKFRHVFLRYNEGNFQPVPLKINNLGADTSRHDGSDYKPTPISRSNQEKDHFTNLIEKKLLNQTPKVEEIQEVAEQHLKELIPKIAETEHAVKMLEDKVAIQRKEISELRIQKSNELNHDSDGKFQKRTRQNRRKSSHTCPNEAVNVKPSQDFDREKVKSDMKSEPRDNFRNRNELLTADSMDNSFQMSETVKKPSPNRISYSRAVKKSSD